MPHFIYASGQKDARRFVLTQGERTCAGLGSEAIKSTPAFNCQGKLVVPDLCCPVMTAGSSLRLSVFTCLLAGEAR